jgi:hypothetical protein
VSRLKQIKGGVREEDRRWYWDLDTYSDYNYRLGSLRGSDIFFRVVVSRFVDGSVEVGMRMWMWMWIS